MRKTFFEELYKLMTINQDVYAITGDLGYIGFDNIRDHYPKRFINVGAAEQTMLDIAVGLAQDGKIPFVYSITPFLLYRGFETLRTYIDHEGVNVKLCGSGRDDDYSHDGYSHDATDAKTIISTLSNIDQIWPEQKEEIPLIIKEMSEHNGPQFLSLKR